MRCLRLTLSSPPHPRPRPACSLVALLFLRAQASLVDISAVLTAVEKGAIKRFGSLDVPSPYEVPADLKHVLDLPSVLIAGRPRITAGGLSSAAAASAAASAADTPGAAEVDATTGAVSFGVAADGGLPDVARICVFSCRSYGIFGSRFAAAAAAWNADASKPIKLRFECYPSKLSAATAHLASGCRAVCDFVNDEADADVVRTFKGNGTQIILNRCAGFDKVDLAACAEHGMKVARVPAYSPEAVAQMGASLLLSLAWRLSSPPAASTSASASASASASTSASGAVLKPSLLLGPGTTVGVLGTGRIGYLFAMIMQGLGCRVIAYDPYKNAAIEAAGIPYLEIDEILAQADVISLHVPLLPATKHMLNAEAIGKLKKGATVVNVSRGGLVDTEAILGGLESGQIGAYGADVYEFEADYFFEDRSAEPLADALLARLIAHPNVQLTGHLAFLTEEALSQIVSTTMLNLSQHLEGVELTNEVKA